MKPFLNALSFAIVALGLALVAGLAAWGLSSLNPETAAGLAPLVLGVAALLALYAGLPAAGRALRRWLNRSRAA